MNDFLVVYIRMFQDAKVGEFRRKFFVPSTSLK